MRLPPSPVVAELSLQRLAAILPLLLLLLLVLTEQPYMTAAARIPSFFQKKKTYTPLLFFKVPKGILPECDAMDLAVTEIVEKEMNLKVERLDILRHPEHEALLNLLTQQQRTPPFLYHRESCQNLYVPVRGGRKGTATTSGAAGGEGIPINKDSLRAWAKGRIVTQPMAVMEDGVRVGGAPTGSSKPIVLEQEDEALEQAELLNDMTLTPEQREGKRLMEERTKKRKE